MVMEHNFNCTSHESDDVQEGDKHTAHLHAPGASAPTDTAFCGLQFRAPGGSSPPDRCLPERTGCRARLAIKILRKEEKRTGCSARENA